MTFTAKELASLIGAELAGNPEVTVSDFAKIEEAKEGDLAFLANPKYTHYIYDTKASVVLVRKDFTPERPVNATLLKVDDPYATLAALMQQVTAMLAHKPKGFEEPVHIDPTASIGKDIYVGAFAYISRGAKVGDRTLIYPQVFIGEDVTIGEDCVIYPGVKIYKGCRIGNRCILQAGCVIGGDGFGFAPTPEGFKKIPQIGCVEIEDDVEIGANTTIDRATMGCTRIGRGTKLDNLIQVAHNVTIGHDNVFAAQTGIAGSTRIGSCNMVGGQCGFAGHITVGDHNEFGAQSGIPNTVGSGKRLIGYPAVDAGTFARSVVYIKKLPELFRQLKDK